MTDVVSLTLPAVTLDGVGWTGTGAITGTADLALPALTSSAESSINGSASLTLPRLTLSATGYTGITGTASLSLPMLTLQAAGHTGITGSLNASLAAISLAAEGYTGILGTANLTLPMLQVTAGGSIITGTANLTIPALRLVATGYAGPASTTNAWALNTQKMALSEYDVAAFNSMATFNGVHLAATSAGIFALSGDLDGAAEIDAVLRTGKTDFGTTHLKRVERLWVGYTSDGDMNLTVITTGDDGAELRTTYPLPATGATGLHGNSVKIGQGLKSRYWQFEAANVDGSNFSLDTIEAKPLFMKARKGGGNA